ncbi:MAG TPA: NUMOD3 domain-containing DNA-binding protein [Candidatus Absconditabacterales bacterium]|nr:NUMOD3 domain-containing DNA-binding protein [Candidatus Absconditabacterales bacterium]
MNYQKIYDQIIDRAQKENRRKSKEVYFERHHIIPKCLGGSNEKSNLVLLTAREHFLCHWILYRLHPTNSKLLFAFKMMCDVQNRERMNRFVPSSRIVAEAREAFSTLIRTLPKTEETKQKISKANLGRIWTEEARKNHKEGVKGCKKPTRTPEHLSKISEALKGKKKKPFSEEHKRKISETLSKKQKTSVHLLRISEALKGRELTEETKQKIREKNTGKKHTEETKQKMREKNTGKKHTEETKQKMKHPKPVGFGEKVRQRNLDRGKLGPLQRLQCPHCNVEMSINNIYRFHFDNCKNK